MRLIAMANELLAMARDIENGERLTSHPQSEVLADNNTPERVVDLPIWTEIARHEYDNRRIRAAVFGTDEIFGEPAWDILLDLFIAAKERRRISVTSACIASAVPSTTALRWITILEQMGLIERVRDERDARRIYVRLTPDGYSRMLEYVSKSGIPAVPVERLDDLDLSSIAEAISR